MPFPTLIVFGLLSTGLFHLARAQSHWPLGAVAQASSEALGNPQYNDSFAIDGDKTTFWNDATLGEFPDTLTIAMPEALILTGIMVLSNAGGWPTHYEVEGLSSNFSWDKLAELRDIPSYLSTATFDGSVKCSQFRINVFNATAASGMPLHTRINEVYPIYANETTPVSGSSTPTSGPPAESSTGSPSNQPKSDSPRTHRRSTMIIIGVVAGSCAVFAIIAGIIFWARHRRHRGQSPIWGFNSKRKIILDSENKVSELSVGTLSAELETPQQVARKELCDSRLPAQELATPNIPRTELAAGFENSPKKY